MKNKKNNGIKLFFAAAYAVTKYAWGNVPMRNIGITRGAEPIHLNGTGLIFVPLVFQAARNRYRDRLAEIDEALGLEISLLEEEIETPTADAEVVNGIEDFLVQGSLSGNLREFAFAASNGELQIDLADSVRNIILKISKSDAVKAGVESGRDFGDLSNEDAKKVLAVITAIADIYRNER